MEQYQYQEAHCVEELLDQYEQTLKKTEEKLSELKREILSYSEIYEDEDVSLEVREWAEEMAAPFLHDKSIVSSWKRNLEYSIAWMKTGHRPGNKRGIERRAAYQIEKPFDPLLMQRFFRSTETEYEWDREEKESVITPTERSIVDAAMSCLSEKEREVYIMSRGNGHSQRQIAKMMNLSRNSVKTMLSRADKKIGKIVATLKQEGES